MPSLGYSQTFLFRLVECRNGFHSIRLPPATAIALGIRGVWSTWLGRSKRRREIHRHRRQPRLTCCSLGRYACRNHEVDLRQKHEEYPHSLRTRVIISTTAPHRSNSAGSTGSIVKRVKGFNGCTAIPVEQRDCSTSTDNSNRIDSCSGVSSSGSSPYVGRVLVSLNVLAVVSRR